MSMVSSVDHTCRICLSESEPDCPLVLKCGCRGTNAWVHDDCLSHWRRRSENPEAAYRCNTCHDAYRDALSLELLEARLRGERLSLGDRSRRTLCTIRELGTQLKEQGQYEAAELMHREALAARRAILGDRHKDTLTSMSDLAIALQFKGDMAAAERLHLEHLLACREAFGNQNAGTLMSINNLATLLETQGNLAAAEPLHREALAAKRELLGPRHVSTLNSMNNFASLLHARGELANAELLYREALEGFRATAGDRHPHTLATVGNLAILLCEAGALDEAEEVLGDAPTVVTEVLGPDHDMSLVIEAKASRIVLARTSDAAPLRAAVERMQTVLGADHTQTLKYTCALTAAGVRSMQLEYAGYMRTFT